MDTTTLIEEGKELLSKFRISEAENAFQKALQADTRSVGARLWLSRTKLLRQQPEQGAHLLDEALEVEPNNAEALALKGVYFMGKADWKRAVEHLESARNIDPNLEMVHTNLARCYRKLDDLDRAEASARRSIELDGRSFQAHYELSYALGKTGRVAEGIEELIIAVRINPYFLKAYLVLGHLYKVSGKGDLAIRMYNYGIRKNPLAIPLREELAGLYAFQRDFSNAYEQAVRIAVLRNDYRDWLRVGMYAVALGKFEKAEKAFKKSLEIEPTSWDGHYNLGELYFAAKLYTEAKEQYQKAIEKDGNNFKPWNGMGLFLLQVERKPEEARKFFLRALEISPTQKEPMLNMALTCADLKEYPNTEKFALAAIRVSREGDGIREQAAQLLQEVRNLAKAKN